MPAWYDGPQSAFGQLQTDRPSEALDAFKKFTKDKKNREKADIPEEARKLAVELAGVEGFSKASFYLDPLAQARTLDHLCSFGGGMEDCCASKEMLERTLKMYEKHLGGDHWEVAATLNDLGNAYGSLGDHNKKKDLLERALEIRETHYGEDHIEVAITLANLGIAYGDLGDHNMKKNLLERALKIDEKHYGREHFVVAITLYNLALAHRDLGDRGNEARFLIEVLPIFERHFGIHHVGEESTQRCRKIAHRSRSAESRAMRGLFHFSVVILGGERETSAPRGACGCLHWGSVISVQGWFDRVTFQSSAGHRNVIYVLSTRIFVHATRWSMLSARIFVHVAKWSMFLVVSVIELAFGAATFPEPTRCTTHVTFCTRRQV